jgi:N-acetylneuraminic acid mutarotase
VHHAAAVGLAGKLYLIGGYVDGWTPTDEVHEYDPTTDSWRARAPMPTPRGALAAAVIDGKIHAVSGNAWRGRNTGAHEVYDPAADRWKALAAVPTPRDHLAVAALDGRLYAIGGRVDGSYARNLDVRGLRSRHQPLAAAVAHAHGAQRDRCRRAGGTHLPVRRRGDHRHLL